MSKNINKHNIIVNSNSYIGRTEQDAPEVDAIVLAYGIPSNINLKTGDFINVKITHTNIYDSAGKFIE